MTSPLRAAPGAVIERFGDQLDTIGGVLGSLADRVGPGRLKDLLSGTWQGHPLHPVLTDVTLGAWTSAAILDLVEGQRSRGADTLVGLGVISAVPTALTGWSDWADATGEARRVGVAHAAGNAAATVLYGASWLARRTGSRKLGVALSFAGAGVATATAYLGGHLVYGKGVGVDVTAFDKIPSRFTPVMDADDLLEGTPTLTHVDSVPVFLLRRGDTVFAMHDRCTHRGGPLHEGKLEGDTIVCPWHGSCFNVTDGDLQRGPATAPQPSYEARIRGGRVEIRR